MSTRLIRSIGVTTWWLVLLVLWSRFWSLDLRFSNTEDLLLVPLSVGMIAGGVAVVLGYPWWRAFGLGVAIGLLPVLVYFWLRAMDVGCIGVSDAYGDAVAGSFILYMFFLLDCTLRRPVSTCQIR